MLPFYPPSCAALILPAHPYLALPRLPPCPSILLLPCSSPYVQPAAPTIVALDEYLAWIGNTYYTATETGGANSQWALLRRTTLGRVTAPGREACILDDWAPLEVVKFESAICLCGKQFPLIAKVSWRKLPMIQSPLLLPLSLPLT